MTYRHISLGSLIMFNEMNENNNILDVETELDDAITKAEPELQDAIKRGFTNNVMQLSRVERNETPLQLENTFYCSDDAEVVLSELILKSRPQFHVHSVSLDLRSLSLSLRCGLGDVVLAGHYHATSERLHSIIPVSSDGHIEIKMSNVEANGEIGLQIIDDSFDILNPGIDFIFSDVSLKVAWPAPKPTGGYEFITSEKTGKVLDDVPAAYAISRELSRVLKRELINHIRPVLQNTACISEMLGGSPDLIEAYLYSASRLNKVSNRAIDIILMEVRKSILQKEKEVITLPVLNANFTKKVGPLSIMGKFITSEGWLRDLSTINRTKDANMKTGLTKSSFFISLGLQYLKIGFDEYKIKFMGFGPKGRIEVTVAENSIYLAMTAGISQWKPYARIDDFKIEYFEGLDIHITGLGPFNWLISKISTWLIGYTQVFAMPFVEDRIKEEVQKALEKINVWEIIKGKIPA